MCTRLATVARVFIAILSLVFAILGFGVLLIGIVAKSQIDALQQLWQPLISTITAEAKSQASSSIHLSTDYLDINQLVGGLSTAFIVLGLFVFLIGVVGMLSACCMIKVMTICYLAVVAVMTVIMLILVIILAVNRNINVTDPPKAELKTTLNNEYRGFNGTDVTSILWNTIMIWQQCCGLDNYKDFDSAATWKALFGSSSSFGYATPAACCKSGQFNPPTSEACAVTPTTTNNNMETGCYDKILDLFLTGSNFTGFACGTVLGFALLTVFSSIILYKTIKKSKEKAAEYDQSTKSES